MTLGYNSESRTIKTITNFKYTYFFICRESSKEYYISETLINFNECIIKNVYAIVKFNILFLWLRVEYTTISSSNTFKTNFQLLKLYSGLHEILYYIKGKRQKKRQ